jgi:hypothetical protein
MVTWTSLCMIEVAGSVKDVVNESVAGSDQLVSSAHLMSPECRRRAQRVE